jgi:hypothetical protein
MYVWFACDRFFLGDSILTQSGETSQIAKVST